jgi:Restriction endonuclease
MNDKNYTKISCPWHKLNDEQFEELCYHVIPKHYKPTKIRKMGKSRFRDGGRDIEFYTPERLGTYSKKWIVQCKLIRDGSSLAASRINNIMDTIAQYGADGFCVITSSVIDSGLYDKLENIKRNYGIEIDDWSKLEIENFLDKHRELRDKYFFD